MSIKRMLFFPAIFPIKEVIATGSCRRGDGARETERQTGTGRDKKRDRQGDKTRERETEKRRNKRDRKRVRDTCHVYVDKISLRSLIRDGFSKQLSNEFIEKDQFVPEPRPLLDAATVCNGGQSDKNVMTVSSSKIT